MTEKKVKFYGREYPAEEVKSKGIIDFDHQNFSAEDEEQIKKEIMPIPGQIVMIQGTQCVHCGAKIPPNGRCTKCAGTRKPL